MGSIFKRHSALASKNIKIKNFITFCSIDDNKFVIQDEFKAIQDIVVFSKPHEFRKYEHKNQYNEVLPYCHNRVKLEPSTFYESDYINATHIKGYKQTKQYIATQHPLSSTVYDFWAMVIQNKCRTIVMLTEMCTQKLHKYYPDRNVQFQFNDISIVNIHQSNFKTFRRRVLLISTPRVKRLVMHYHILTWPDPNSLEKTTELVNFIRYIRNESDATHSILVHSSSGVGRTGIYIALDILMDQAQHKRYVNIFKVVVRLCWQRQRMITCLEQYQLIYEVLDTHIMHTIGRIRL